ncbi:MAG TPA: Ig-like domain-containing protein [Kofleriaceae bacterium]
MIRYALVSLLVAATAAAQPAPHKRPANWIGDRRIAVVTPTSGFTAATGAVTGVIYVNRCSGGCQVTQSDHSDAKLHLSPDVQSGTSTLTEFQNDAHETGALADAEWAQVVKCMQEVYSPFAVTVTDQRPTSGQWTEIMIAGQPQDLGFPNTVLGIAPVHVDCNAYDNALSFAFANADVPTQHVYNVCWTAAQETAHNFGLDHEYQYATGESACNDPMTYRYDCGGEKFFRNEGAFCGENAVRACICPNQTQNSHQKILSVFGPGTPITAPPAVAIVAPAAGDTVVNGAPIGATASAQRGVARLELYVNGHKWAETVGAKFGVSGQPETTYAINLPANVPDGVMDLVVKAYDDIEVETDSATVTVTKGVACANASSCATGQKCEAGKCFWDAPVGVLGDNCTFNEYCVSGVCTDSDIGQYCSQACVVNSADGCPLNFDCVATSDAQGQCLPHDTGGGCCSVDRHESNRSIWAHLGLGVLAMSFIFRRRRSRYADRT